MGEWIMKYAAYTLVLFFTLVTLAQQKPGEKSVDKKNAVSQVPVNKAKSVVNQPKPVNQHKKSLNSGYKVRLTELRNKVNELKSRVFDAKERLDLLRLQIQHTLVSESKLEIIHYNDVSSFLKLKKVEYFLDGDNIYSSDNRNNMLNEKREFTVYTGSVSPTHHILSVRMIYQGGGGFFSYLKAYRFKIRGSLPFFAARGQKVVIRVVGYQKGGLSRLEDSPTMRFEVKRINLREKLLKAEGK